MMISKMNIAILALSVLGLFACNNSRVIEAENAAPSKVEAINPHVNNPHASNPHADATMESGRQVIEVSEVLQAERYTYIRGEVKGNEIWLVAPKTNVETGGKYAYDGGLLKKNYQSQEFDRMFDEIYLIGRLEKVSTSKSGSAVDEAISKIENVNQPKPGAVKSQEPVEGVTPLSDILNDPKSFKGKIVTVRGTCVKVNNQIMDRNWVHLQDGESTNGKLNDLTITTNEQVLMGSTATFTGKIVVDQDFGAGYTYDVLLEAAILKM